MPRHSIYARDTPLDELKNALVWIHDIYTNNPIEGLANLDDSSEVDAFRTSLLRLQMRLREEAYGLMADIAKGKELEGKELAAKAPEVAAELKTELEETQDESQIHVTEDLFYPGSQYIETQHLAEYVFHTKALDRLKFRQKAARPLTPANPPSDPEPKRPNNSRIIKTVDAVKKDQESA